MSQLQLTMADAKRALEQGSRAQQALTRIKAKGEEAAGEIARTAISGGTGYLLGLVNGAGVFKDSRIGPVPLELAASLLFLGARVMGIGGKHGEHLATVGNAALACYTHVLGLHTGMQHWGTATAKAAGTMGGDLADRLARIAAA
jgi:hypothetical protein